MHKVMIVEDEKIIREGLVKAIPWCEWGFEVAAVSNNGRQALEYLNICQIDVIVTDIRMPNMDGIELLCETKKIRPELPVIFISGYEEFEYARKALEYGAFAYVLKLFLRKELKNVMGNVKAHLQEKENNKKLKILENKVIVESKIREVILGEPESNEFHNLHSIENQRGYFYLVLININNYFSLIKNKNKGTISKKIAQLKDNFETEIKTTTVEYYIVQVLE